MHVNRSDSNVVLVPPVNSSARHAAKIIDITSPAFGRPASENIVSSKLCELARAEIALKAGQGKYPMDQNHVESPAGLYGLWIPRQCLYFQTDPKKIQEHMDGLKAAIGMWKKEFAEFNEITVIIHQPYGYSEEGRVRYENFCPSICESFTFSFDDKAKLEDVAKQAADKIKEATKGSIPDYKVEIKNRGVLINASSYEGGWDKAFDPRSTRARQFTTGSGETVIKNLMHKKGTTALISDKLPEKLSAFNFALVEDFSHSNLGFGNAACTAFFPFRGQPRIDDILALLDFIHDRGLKDLGLEYKRIVDIAIPKQKIKYEADILNPELTGRLPDGGYTEAKQISVTEHDETGARGSQIATMIARDSISVNPRFEITGPYFWVTLDSKAGIVACGYTSEPIQDQ